MYRRLWGLRLCSEDRKIVLTAVYHLMHKNKCLVPNIVILEVPVVARLMQWIVNTQVASMSHGITAWNFSGKAISSATFTKTKNLTRGIYVKWLYKQLPGFRISIISLLRGKIAFFSIVTLRSCERVAFACGLSYEYHWYRALRATLSLVTFAGDFYCGCY